MTKEPSTVDDIDDAHLMCRDFGHAWRPVDVRLIRQGGEIHRVFRCMHECGTERTQVLSSDGYLLRNFYSYAEGYVLHGLGRLSADDRAHIRVMGTQYIKLTGQARD